MRDLDIWYSRVDVDTVEHFRSGLAANRGKQLHRTVAKAERKNSHAGGRQAHPARRRLPAHHQRPAS